ncbi:MAG: ABC transporter ATP-binding protein [Armatimonadetes bacterium]|nr:ABC transporter ATP-binding protein [Armatimonadota bacterium]
MIQFSRASRWYGEVIGLNDISCEIGPGVTALLGQNGAGKSTMMKLITGQMRPTTGEVRVFGETPFANPNVYARMGYCPDVDSFPEHLSGREFVRRMGLLSGVSKQAIKDRTEEVLTLVGMVDRADKPVKGYSKGMRQRIKLAQAMIHDPDFILLDEPLNGLDPIGRREFMGVLQQLADRGKGVLVSSHILFEVEQMTRSILLLHRGRLLAAGDLSNIRALIDSHPHRIRMESRDPRALAAKCAGFGHVLSVKVDEALDEVEITTRKPDEFYDAVMGMVLDDGLTITAMDSPDNNLESVYGYLTEGR